MLEVLLDHGARDDTGSALVEAARRGYLDAVKLMWDRGADVSAAAISSGSSVLAAAAGCGYLDMVKALLDLGADVNTQPTGGFGIVLLKALRVAAGGGYLDVVKTLLGHGADVNEGPASTDGRTALGAAAEGE